MKLRRRRKDRPKSNRKRRGWKLWALVLAVLLIGGGTAAYFTVLQDDDEGEGSIAREGESGPPSIRYVEGNVLKRTGPDQDQGEEIYEGVSATARPSPGGRFLYWVAFAGESEPITHLYDTEANEILTVPGTDPTWDGDGTQLALLRPSGDNTTCEIDECTGPSTLAVYDASSRESASLGDSKAEWVIHGWIDDHVVVGKADDEDGTLLIPVGEGEPITVEFPAEEIRSISPDGRWMVANTQRGPELFEFKSEADEEGQIDLSSGADYEFEFVDTLGAPDLTYTSIDWRADSSAFASVYSDLTNNERGIRLVDPEAQEVEVLDVGDEVVGDVFWSTEGGGVIFTAVNRDESQLEATYCPLDDSDCTVYLTWQTDISVVGPTP